MEFSTVPREATLSYLNKLVPLRITMNKDAKPWVLLLWFVPTPEFVSALPQRWQQSVRSSVTLCDSVVISKEDLIAHKKDIAKQRQDRESIAGIEALKLSAAELTNLGISVQGDSVFIPIEEYISKTDTLPPSFKDSTLRKSYAIKHQELLKKLQAQNYDITADQILVRSTRSFALSGSEDKRTLLYAQWDNSKPNPLCAVGHNKVLWNYKRSKQNSEIGWDSYYIVNNLIDAAPMLRMPSLKTTSSSRDSSSNPNSYPIEMMYSTLCSKAIPVEIEFDNINSLVEHARNTNSKLDSTAFRKMTLRLWFVPTQEFIEHLPERYRSVMQREYKLLEKVIKGEIQAEQACTELQDNKASSYLQLCQYSSGTLRSLSLAPNPAESQVSCNYVLSQSSPISIKLYNDKGSFVSELVSNYQAKAGPNTIDLNLPQLSSGFYIIVLSNDRGEQITQRLAVQR